MVHTPFSVETFRSLLIAHGEYLFAVADQIAFHSGLLSHWSKTPWAARSEVLVLVTSSGSV